MPKVDFRVIDGWEVMYIDGVKVLEAHALRYREVLKALNISYTRKYYKQPNWDVQEIMFGETPDNVTLLNYDLHSEQPLVTSAEVLETEVSP